MKLMMVELHLAASLSAETGRSITSARPQFKNDKDTDVLLFLNKKCFEDVTLGSGSIFYDKGKRINRVRYHHIYW